LLVGSVGPTARRRTPRLAVFAFNFSTGVLTLKFSILSVSLVAATLTALAADQPNANPADNSASMKKALLEIQEQMQANEARHQAELDALKKQLTAQQAVIDSLQKNAA